MLDGTSLGSFISEVSKELQAVQSQDPGKARFELTDVTLEISFTLDASASGGAKLMVVEVGGSTKTSEAHKVTVRLQPIAREASFGAERQPTDPPALGNFSGMQFDGLARPKPDNDSFGGFSR
ncbi:MAG: trypco2 family protein [Candidatus Krumholzibacteriia bacterium]